MKLTGHLETPVFVILSKDDVHQKGAVLLTARQLINFTEDGTLYIARQVQLDAIDATMIEASVAEAEMEEHER